MIISFLLELTLYNWHNRVAQVFKFIRMVSPQRTKNERKDHRTVIDRRALLFLRMSKAWLFWKSSEAEADNLDGFVYCSLNHFRIQKNSIGASLVLSEGVTISSSDRCLTLTYSGSHGLFLVSCWLDSRSSQVVILTEYNQHSHTIIIKARK